MHPTAATLLALLGTTLAATLWLAATPAAATSSSSPHSAGATSPASSRPPGAGAARWRPPVPGQPTRLFALGPDPFARGQHRGVDLDAAPGEVVRSACGGRVVFAGRVARVGTVSVRCGRWRVSYAPLARVAVREGAAVGPGARLGRIVGDDGLHFGVRRKGRRFGYVDPLLFLADPHAPAPPPVRVRPPRGAPPPRAVPQRVVLRPARASAREDPGPAPWPVWAGLALGLTGLVGAGRLALPFRRQGGRPCPASSTSSSSPTTPSSP
jgi:hypothetical protein